MNDENPRESGESFTCGVNTSLHFFASRLLLPPGNPPAPRPDDVSKDELPGSSNSDEEEDQQNSDEDSEEGR